MADCCTPDCGRFFNRRVADHDAKRYRERGLTGSARGLVALAGDVNGASVLDVGGGVGGIELDLIAAGASRATSVELSPAYENAAHALLGERDLEERVTRVVGDFVAEADTIDAHDVVVMHRVVCCYPDAGALVRTAAEKAQRRLLLTYPQRRTIVRAGLAAVNAFLRMSRAGFRVYAHPFAEIAAAAEAEGLSLERRVKHGLLWESAAFAR
jgi:2-polyprenyl-3-methyl-5-hydroxy-6-metoxy-1,4-benzoquinol methylase